MMFVWLPEQMTTMPAGTPLPESSKELSEPNVGPMLLVSQIVRLLFGPCFSTALCAKGA